MSDDFKRRLGELFAELSLVPENARGKYLDDACGSDAGLRAELESLLAADRAGGYFLENPAIDAHRDWFTDEAESAAADGEVGRTPDRIGSYRILRTLGKGGMGVVYLAEEEGTIRRHVALKVIKSGMDTEEVIARFQSELGALARMSHSYIARVYASGATPMGRPYFAMEYVPGESITKHCEANRLGIEERLRIFVDVCDAVQHAHGRGIIHRDIKPSNILVTREGERSVAKVIDFGIAKAVDVRQSGEGQLTEHGRIVGTPEYMSPEQAAGDPLDVDTRTDVYALGVLLYELLTGALPFDTRFVRGVPPIEAQRTLRDACPARPSSRLRLLGAEIAERSAEARSTRVEDLRRALRCDLDWIVMKAIEMERDRRYATASELAADIERRFRHEPVLASPPSLAYRSRKLLRKHRGPVAATLVVLVALVAGLAISTTMYFRADRARADTKLAAEALGHALARSEARRLTAQSVGLLPSRPDLALLLALEGVKLHRELESLNAVSSALAALVPNQTLVGHSEAMVESAAFDPTSKRVVTAGWDDTARVWDAETGTLIAILSHANDVRKAVFSRDGTRILTATRSEACIWNASVEGRPPRLVERLEHESLTAAAFSPEGGRVLTAGTGGAVRLWDAASGRPLRSIETHDTLNAAHFSPDGDRILATFDDRPTQIWDAESGRVVSTLGSAGTYLAAFSPDGERVVITSQSSGEAVLWDASEEKPVLALRGHEGLVSTLSFSSDGVRLVTGSLDWTAIVWDVASGARLWTLRGHELGIRRVSFSPDDRWVITASLDHTASLWDAASGVPLVSLKGHSAKLNAAVFSPDGRRVSTAAEDGTARVWDLEAGLGLPARKLHEAEVNCVAFSPDGRFLLTASNDRTARIWDLRSSHEHFVLRGHQAQVVDAAFSPDGRRVATAAKDGTARLWNAETGEETQEFSGPTRFVRSARFSPDGSNLVISCGNEARIFAVGNEREPLVLAGHAGGVYSAEFSSSGQRVVTASRDGTARVWDADTGAVVSVLEGHEARLLVAAFSPDARTVVTSAADGTARIWDPSSGKELHRLRGGAGTVVAAAFSPDGRRVVTSTYENDARIWDVESGAELAALIGHDDRVMSAEFSPDGRMVLTASWDKTARLWNAESGAELVTLEGHRGRVQHARFCPGGEFVATGSWDRTARLWPVDPVAVGSEHKTRELDPNERDYYEIGSEEERLKARTDWERSVLCRDLDVLQAMSAAGAGHEQLYAQFARLFEALLERGEVDAASRYLETARERHDPSFRELEKAFAELESRRERLAR